MQNGRPKSEPLIFHFAFLILHFAFLFVDNSVIVRKAKILATLGPASREPVLLEALLAAGANGVRINMSHGTQDEHAENITRESATTAGMISTHSVSVDLFRTQHIQG